MRILATSSERIRVVTFGITAVVMVSLLANCASPSTFSRTVYEGPTVLVRLDSPLFQEEITGAPSGHIPALSAADLVDLLRSMRIQPEISLLSYWVMRNEPQPELAFPNDDATLLAPHLRVALARARPTETAVFFLRRTREDGIPLVTTGGLRIDGNQLIVLLANARKPTTTQRKLETARDSPLHPFGEMDFHFVPGPYQTTLARKDFPTNIVMTSAPALSVDYRALLAGHLRHGQASSPTQTEPEIPAGMIEDKLHRLKTWHEQGLITDDEYLKKRQELLKQF
jgi:hypothetical protein